MLKKVALLTLLMAAPAVAEDHIYGPTEYPGHVRNWRPVCEARYESRINGPEMDALMYRQQATLTYATAAMYRPLITTPAAPTAPAPAAAPLAPMSPPGR